MNVFAKLIYQTYASYLSKGFPAQYYGMPNGKIYVIFSRFYKAFGKSQLEFVFAEHKDYSYDYQNEVVLSNEKSQWNKKVFVEQVDAPRIHFSIFIIHRKLKSYAEAFRHLNRVMQHTAASA